MSQIESLIKTKAVEGLEEVFGKTVSAEDVNLQETRKEFEGEVTLVTFPLAKLGMGNPQEVGEKLGEWLVNHVDELSAFNVIKGFLNLSLSDAFLKAQFQKTLQPDFFRLDYGKGTLALVEFCSPNTNKPLHLGHLRNNFLGDSVSRLFEATGHEVVKVCLYNDRGIAICKSMLMYQRYANGATPESAGKKPDFFVVDYYVRFGLELAKEVAAVLAKEGIDEKEALIMQMGASAVEGTSQEEAAEIKKKVKIQIKEKGLDIEEIKKDAPVNQAAQEMLRQWEAGEPEVMALWKQLNNWVYEGFEATYKRMNISFDEYNYESQTYLLGNDLVKEGLENDVFFKKEDGSTWIDLSDDGLDQKAVLRSDGTSMYITQDIGTAQMRFDKYGSRQPNYKPMYVVATEQDYHFKVLFLIMEKLGRPFAKEMLHLSYGMVDLAGGGRMKTREGTTVDADVLFDEVVQKAKDETLEKGIVTENDEQFQPLTEMLGIGGLKFYVLKVDPKRRMVFDPKESVQLQGDTNSLISYAHARTHGIRRKVKSENGNPEAYTKLEKDERRLIHELGKYPAVLESATRNMSPAEMANYMLDLAKAYNSFQHNVQVNRAPTEDAKAFRLQLCEATGNALREGMSLLGIDLPEMM